MKPASGLESGFFVLFAPHLPAFRANITNTLSNCAHHAGLLY
jgi:hypothetical protein